MLLLLLWRLSGGVQMTTPSRAELRMAASDCYLSPGGLDGHLNLN